MNENLESRLQRLQRTNRLLLAFIACAFLTFFMSGSSAPDEEDIVRCKRLEVLDTDGKIVAVLGVDADGTRGLFVYDSQDRVRTAAIHDNAQSAFYAFDSTGTIRVGLAQFSHGGGGVALHGEQSKGGAVLYYKNGGSLTFFNTEGETTARIPEKK